MTVKPQSRGGHDNRYARVARVLLDHPNMPDDAVSQLALLWQIYSRCFSSLIQDRQYGHR